MHPPAEIRVVGCVASAAVSYKIDNTHRCRETPRPVNDLNNNTVCDHHTATTTRDLFIDIIGRHQQQHVLLDIAPSTVMPASTLDPLTAAMCTSLAKADKNGGGGGGGGLDAQLAGATRKVLLGDVEFEPAGSYQSAVLDKLKSKYIVLKGTEPSPQQPR